MSGNRCVVRTCSSRRGKSGKCVAFHAFPSREPQRSQWVDFVRAVGPRDWTPVINSRICSLHFAAGCYRVNPVLAKQLGLPGNTRRLLEAGATPTVYTGVCPTPTESSYSLAKRPRHEVRSWCSCAPTVRPGHINTFHSTQSWSGEDREPAAFSRSLSSPLVHVDRDDGARVLLADEMSSWT